MCVYTVFCTMYIKSNTCMCSILYVYIGIHVYYIIGIKTSISLVNKYNKQTIIYIAYSSVELWRNRLGFL